MDSHIPNVIDVQNTDGMNYLKTIENNGGIFKC